MQILQFSTHMTFMLSFLGLTLNHTHLVSAFLCLEGMALALFLTLATQMTNSALTAATTAPMLLLAFFSCEASTSLALLTASSRTHSTDHIKNLNLLQC